MATTTDPSCAVTGRCGALGSCEAGRIGDPCMADADCNLASGTCWLLVTPT